MSGSARSLDRAIAVYQRWLSPALGRRCRYEPTCSHYAREALRRYGAKRGSLLAAKRVLRCHPWAPGGVDHVPAERKGNR
ncbi:membrane protein insertion efficiency factor YidD [soil metagenome]